MHVARTIELGPRHALREARVRHEDAVPGGLRLSSNRRYSSKEWVEKEHGRGLVSWAPAREVADGNPVSGRPGHLVKRCIPVLVITKGLYTDIRDTAV